MRDLWHLARLWSSTDLFTNGGTCLCTTTEDGAIVKTIVDLNDEYNETASEDDLIEQPKWICLGADVEALPLLNAIEHVGDAVAHSNLHVDVEKYGRLDVAIGQPKWFRLEHIGDAVREMLAVAKHAVVYAPVAALADPGNAKVLGDFGYPHIHLLEDDLPGLGQPMAWLHFSPANRGNQAATVQTLRRAI